jgi:primosomal protein DnaI
MIYWPEFLRTLKASFDTDFNDKYEYIKKIPLLLIDDIGAENLTAWARDEILGPILQYRMQENLSTFFTSNLNLEELEAHFSMTSNKVDKVKAKRIMERIKYLTGEMSLISENNRK